MLLMSATQLQNTSTHLPLADDATQMKNASKTKKSNMELDYTANELEQKIDKRFDNIESQIDASQRAQANIFSVLKALRNDINDLKLLRNLK
jgi:hypothetical protein